MINWKWVQTLKRRLGLRESAPNRPVRSAVVYTREGCHLCELAEQVLAKYGLAIERVDIDHDPALRDRYGTCIPVVWIDGRERFRGRVNEVLLRRLLKAPPAAPQLSGGPQELASSGEWRPAMPCSARIERHE